MNKLRFVNKMASVYRYATLLSNINHNLFIFILVSLILPMSERASAKIYGAQPIYDGDKRLTKEYHLRQGSIRGLIVQPGRQYELQSVEMFLGIPYAAPPVGNLRFMPPGSSLPWSGVKMATEFAPVCPQMLPNVNKENPPSSGRQQYMSRLLPFLKNESEDCLYLNVYVPNQERKPKKMPVLVFIHGDSFEWSSGNPYDGRILASYGNVMVVTINFRLGILGFMKPSLTEHVYGNQGLLDQLAALQWIKDNIGDLNGDPNSVTLMGHGTGAAAVNFLMISPISNGLFHRAILMSGSALSDWALTKNPMQYTVQVAQHLNCNISSRDIMSCLQSKRLSDIKKVQILARRFATPLGPVVAGSFIPNEPAQTIESYPNLFSKYELLSGVAELESYHDFGVIALAHGVLETERDEILAQYSQLQYDAAPEIAAKDILQEYSPMRIDPQRWGVNVNRDFVLDVLSDARTVAPLVMTANYHSKANPKSYVYVFGHNSEHTDYAALRKSVHGEEMPYVLGVPLGGAHTHFHEEYTAKERLLSEAVMRLWTNFVKGGTPNTQRVEQYLTLKSEDWKHYNIDWPEYNVEHQSFLHIDVAPSNFVRSFYRANYTKFWNEVLPNKMKNYAVSSLFEYESVSTTTSRPRKTFLSPGPVVRHNSRPPTPTFPHRPQIFAPAYGRHRHYVPTRPAPDPDEIYKEIKSIKTLSRPVQPELIEDTIRKLDLKPTIPTLPNTSTESPVKSSGATMGIIIAIGCIFLLVNIVIFATLYLKKRRLQARERELKRDTNSNGENVDVSDCYSKPKESTTFEKFKSGCSALKSINWNGISRTDEKHKKVKLQSLKTPKSDDSGGFGQRFKLRRHLSSSTIDAHTKVRDWITNEIINRCSPPIQRKAKLNVELEGKDNLNRHKAFKSDETINQIRKPLTNSKDSLNISLQKETNSILSNNTSTTERPKTKTSEKTTSTSAQGSQSSISTYKKQSHKNRKISTSKSNDSIASSEGKRSNKVSVAIDANPVSINSAVLRQKPIELSKSLDIVEAISCKHEKDKNLLKRSKTDNDFIDSETMVSSCADKNVIFMSVVNFPLNENIVQVTPLKSDVIKISHKHSISDPVKDINYDAIVKCTDFSNIPPPSTFRNEINVTSKDETDRVIPLTAAEALLTIQRRNFPKVLPDLPKSFENSHKRLSLQPNSFQSFRSYLNYDSSQKDNISPAKTPPQPPPRSSSTLDRRIGYKNSKSSATSSFDSGKISFGSTAEKNLNKSDDYCNIDALSSIISEINKSTESNFRTSEIDRNVRSTLAQPVITREFPKVIIAANDIPKVNEPKIIIKPTLEKSSAEIQVNAPRVRLTDNFYGMGSESERSGSSLSMISDIECELEDEFEDDISDAELIEALVGSMDTTFDANDIPDTKGPDNCFENKLEFIPVKVNTTLKSPKNYENIKYCSENVLPDVSGLEKTAQIKQKFSLNKLQSRSESITQPPEKAVKLKDKKVSKTPVFHSHLSKDKTNIASISKLTKHKQDSKKKIPLEHSYSGSSNDTESSTGTVKKVEIKK